MKHTGNRIRRGGRRPLVARPTRPHGETLAATLLLAGTLLAGCGAGGGGGVGSNLSAGSVAENPATGLSFVVDSNHGGGKSTLNVTGFYWGRMVDILDVDRELVFQDFVIGQDIASNGVDYLLERNAITERESLVILHQHGTGAFDLAFGRVEANVQHILDKGLGANVLPPYTMIARNSALVVRFDDLLADGGDPSDPGYPGSVHEDTLRVFSGYPPATPYELRMLPDPNHGDLVGGQFHSSRVILDLTVSGLEAQLLGLQVNSLGLPEAITTTQPNFALRIPTLLHPPSGQFELLTNLQGASVGFTGSGSNDPFSPTLDVVRAARSGGRETVTGDPNNGFLVDDIEPQVLGAQGVNVFVLAGPTGPNADEFLVRVDFATVVCASRPQVGDVMQLPGHVLEVTQQGSTPVNGVAKDVAVKVLVGDPNTLFSIAGQYRTVWDATAGALPECFVRFSPPAGTPPNLDVAVDADVIFSFSEPLDPTRVTAFDTYTLTYDNNPNGVNPLYSKVVGHVRPSTNLVDFVFEPSLPLRHIGPGESYTFTIEDGPGGVSDLAGNGLAVSLPPVQFFIDPNQPTIDSGSVALTFSSTDEDNNQHPEVRGQLLYDLPKGLIKPRPATRFSALADPSQPVVGSMVPILLPIQTPLSNLGSKMMTVWRYHDVGFTLLDDTNHNLDVEGLWWEPYSGTLQIDYFPQFQMRLAHSRRLPDEALTTGLLPKYPGSGLSATFESNWLDAAGEDPPLVAHPKAFGYQLNPLDVVDSATGRKIAPWPMNRNLPQSQFAYWTWRDTSMLGRGAAGGGGVDTKRLLAIGSPGIGNFWNAGDVPTVGLPLLMEFRTYDDAGAVGQNGFKIAIAINSSARPVFRTFSTGGILNSGTAVIVYPDQESTGSGGVNPSNGNTTPPQDNSFYYGRADFVVRVNRVHTIWLDTLASSTFVAPSIEPGPSELPAGTQISMAYRGATQITCTNGDTWTNAQNLSPYGDSYDGSQHSKQSGAFADEFTVTFHPTPGDLSWTTDITDLTGARYVQARITMISNPETGLTPVFSALGIAYIK